MQNIQWKLRRRLKGREKSGKEGEEAKKQGRRRKQPSKNYSSKV
jgi:hypothetical protein